MGDLVRRASGEAVLLPILIGGRRVGAGVPSACGYCVLSAAECERLADEGERALSAGEAWDDEAAAATVRACLVGPLRAAAGRPVFGTLG